MGIFTRRKPPPVTAEPQMGITPEAHTSGAVPGIIDVKGDDLPSPLVQGLHASRRWRGRDTLGQMQGTPAVSTGGGGVLAADHLHLGAPDARRVWSADYPAGEHTGPIGPDAALRRTPETVANFRIDVVRAALPAPDRPRAGSTGADPARTAQMAGWLYMRAFGQWSQDELLGTKALYRSPVAARPLAYAGTIPGAVPSEGGSGPTAPVGEAAPQPNSVRLLPRRWDELLINPGQTAPVVANSEGSRRAAGWRAH